MPDPDPRRLSIGAAAARAGVPPKTIRYYEEIGLVAPARAASGYRAFGAREVAELAFIGRARGLGFSIEECRTLLALWRDAHRASADVKRLAAGHLARIEAKLAELEAMRATLKDLVARCAGDERPDCPIIGRLAPEGAAASEP